MRRIPLSPPSLRHQWHWVLAWILFLTASAHAQSYPLPITPQAVENPYVLHPRDWPPTLGLPNAAIMRTNAGERWFQIETARGVFSPTFGNLFLPETGWVDTARKYHTQLIYTFNTVPRWATHQSGDGPTLSAPSDIDTLDEPCMAPLAGITSAEGNCIWKEWVTALMQKDCAISTPPPHPLAGRCAIRIFEAWNEFNASNFWEDSLAHLAKMSNDMATIVRIYCADCTILAGSTSAGGIGRSGDGPMGSGKFDIALGEFLDAWHALPHPSLPDAVSFHAYPARTNISLPPFPETNISLNDERCTATSVPNVSCYVAIADQPSRVRNILAVRSYLPANIPIWNTESGWNGNKTLFHGLDAAGHTDEFSWHLRQAFLVREAILLANRGVAVNLWYEADHQCWGTLYGLGPEAAPREMGSCSSDPVMPLGLTPAGRALNILYSWLDGATFTGPCTSAGTIWQCPVESPAIGSAVLAWTTRWGTSESANLGSTFHFAHSLDGTTVELRSGEIPLLEGRPRLFNNKQ
jgi:hypothetical protein